MYAPSVDIEAEALDLAEGAAKLAFGTRFKRVPRAILRKLSVPVVFVLGVIVVLYSTAMGVVNRWMENSVPGVLNCGILTVNAALGTRDLDLHETWPTPPDVRPPDQCRPREYDYDQDKDRD